jgi:hypothetical protein
MEFPGLGRPGRGHQPGGHLGKSFAAVLEDFLADPATVGQEPMVAQTQHTIVIPPFDNASHRNHCRSQYWRSEHGLTSGAGSPRGNDRGQFAGARVPQVIASQGRLVAPGESARFGEVTPLGSGMEFRRKKPVMVTTNLARLAALLRIPIALDWLSFVQLLVVLFGVASANIAFKATSGAYLKALARPNDLIGRN